MASTNKTTHYELSQYVSSDKPTYLVDYNGDMAKIDTGINAAKTTADTAATAATNAQTAAATAQTTANTGVTNAATAQTTADGAVTSIGTLANLTTVEKTNLVGAINEVDAKEFVVNSASGNETTKAPSVSAFKSYVHPTISDAGNGWKKAVLPDYTVYFIYKVETRTFNANAWGWVNFDLPTDIATFNSNNMVFAGGIEADDSILDCSIGIRNGSDKVAARYHNMSSNALNISMYANATITVYNI